MTKSHVKVKNLKRPSVYVQAKYGSFLSRQLEDAVKVARNVEMRLASKANNCAPYNVVQKKSCKSEKSSTPKDDLSLSPEVEKTLEKLRMNHAYESDKLPEKFFGIPSFRRQVGSALGGPLCRNKDNKFLIVDKFHFNARNATAVAHNAIFEPCDDIISY